MKSKTLSAHALFGTAAPFTSSRLLTLALSATFLLVAIILVVLLVIGLGNLRALAAASERLAHTHAAKRSLQQLLTTLVDAEAGERGFVITGTTGYLGPYDRARSAIPDRIAEAHRLTADTADQRADLDRLSTLAQLKLDELAKAVRLRRESGFAVAQAQIADNVGKQIMDEMRQIVARMEGREDELLAVRAARVAQSYRTAWLSRMVTTSAALVALLALFLVTRRLGVERLRATTVAERFRVTLASIGDAVIATDEQGQVVWLNAVAESLTGWTQADATGRRLEEVFIIINEETRRPAENPIGRVLRERVTVGLANHTVLIAKDGREIPVDDSAAPIMTADDEFVGAIMVFRDVSERRRAERARAALSEKERLARIEAEEAERQLRVALQAGRLGTWEYSLRSGQVKLSSGLENIRGMAANTFAGTFEAFQEQIHPMDRTRFLETVSETVAQEREHVLEYRIVRPDGAVRWVEMRGQLFSTPDGQPDRIVAICADVTERRQVEEKFRLAVQAAPAGMIMVDQRGIIQLANTLTEQMLGYTRNELVGQSVEHLVPPRFRVGHEVFRNVFFSEPRQRLMGEGRDLYALRKDGTEVAVEIGLSPVETADGLFVLAAITDITERKRTSTLLQQAVDSERRAKREAEHASEMKDHFLAMVSHELRTPLSTVIGWAEILKAGMLDESGRERAVEAMYVNARRQAQLVDDLLDVARIVAGKMRIERTPVNLPAVVRAALSETELSAQAKHIQVSTDIDDSISGVLGDAGRLQQVVTNLMTNAVKFTPENGAVHVSLRRADHSVEISVKDTGRGIAVDFLPSVFEPFRQADPSTWRARGGLGLGLAIVKHLAEAHGGAVQAESGGEGQGATFVVRLPIVAIARDQADVHEPTQVPALSTPPPPDALSGISVLVVDDDQSSRELVAATLESYGAAVLAAASVAEALQVLSKEHIDVLLSDIAMPGEDGFALIRKIRAGETRESQDIPAAALTSFGRDEDRQQVVEAGFQIHLVKPISPRSLIEAVLGLTEAIRR